MGRKDAPLSDVLAVRYAFKKLGAECSHEDHLRGNRPEPVTRDQVMEVAEKAFGKIGKRRINNAIYQIMCDTNEMAAVGKNPNEPEKYLLIQNPYLNINQ